MSSRSFNEITKVNSALVFARKEPSWILRRAAELITERGWMCSTCRVTNTHSQELDIESAILAATGWESRLRDSDARPDSVARSQEREMEIYVEHIVARRDTRTGFTKTMGYVIEVVKLEDLVMWNDEYCLDGDEAVDTLTRSAELAESRGD